MYKIHERVSIEIYDLCQVNQRQDPHTLNKQKKTLVEYLKKSKFTFAKLAVNKTHSYNSPTRRKNSSTCGLFVT